MHYPWLSLRKRDAIISSQKQCDERVILDEKAFDPDAVFMDDIVTEEVLSPMQDFAIAEPNQLEVYGWESNWFKKVRAYIGF